MGNDETTSTLADTGAFWIHVYHIASGEYLSSHQVSDFCEAERVTGPRCYFEVDA